MVAFKRICLTSLFCISSLVHALPVIEDSLDISELQEIIFDIGANKIGHSSKGDVEASTLPGDRPVPGGSPINQCDVTEPQLLDLQSVVITPNPPVRGENLTFIAKGMLKEDVVDGAYVNVEVRYGFIKLIDQTFDLCEEIKKVNMTCPISKGEQVIVKEVEIPNEVPPGRYSVVARAYTTNDDFLTCLSAAVEFPPS